MLVMTDPALIAAIGALASVIGYLGRDLIKQRDLAMAGWKAQTEATNRIAEALEARNRRDAETVRRLDVSVS